LHQAGHPSSRRSIAACGGGFGGSSHSGIDSCVPRRRPTFRTRHRTARSGSEDEQQAEDERSAQGREHRVIA
jgi:hypothetical protein